MLGGDNGARRQGITRAAKTPTKSKSNHTTRSQPPQPAKCGQSKLGHYYTTLHNRRRTQPCNPAKRTASYHTKTPRIPSNLSNRPTDRTNDRPTDRTNDRPTERTTDRPTERTNERTNERTTSKSTETKTKTETKTERLRQSHRVTVTDCDGAMNARLHPVTQSLSHSLTVTVSE